MKGIHKLYGMELKQVNAFGAERQKEATFRGQGTGDRGQGSGVRGQGIEDRGQGTGVRRGESEKWRVGQKNCLFPFTGTIILCYIMGRWKTGGMAMARTERKDTGALLNKAGVSYGDMIRQCRKERGMSQEKLGSLVSVGKNAVGAWEAGRSRPDLSSVPVICEALGITVPEFFGIGENETGSGTPLPGNEHSGKAVRDFSERFTRLNSYHRQVILREMDVLIEMQEKSRPVRKLVRIYRNDLAACAGLSFGIGDDAGEPVWLYADSVTEQADEIISVSGSSMEPAFHDGDQVLVRHMSSIRPGEIGIFTNGDAGYLKEYQIEGLKSLNPAYPMMRFSDGDEVRCVGKVIGKVKRDMLASAADVERYTAEHERG